jgi:TetR/AcrR family transcriptional regulator, ethionamide resistance regulator
MARPLRLSSDQILSAAERVFARRGYADTSLRQLMAAARVSTTAFYARFASKEAVLVALVDRLLGELHRAMGAVLVEVKSREEAVERGADAVVATLSGHERLVALILGEGLSSQSVRAGLARAYRALAELLAAQLAGVSHAAGEPLGDAGSLAWAFVGAVQLQIARWAVFQEIDRDQLSAAMRQVAHTLLPAVAGPPGTRRRKR